MKFYQILTILTCLTLASCQQDSDKVYNQDPIDPLSYQVLQKVEPEASGLDFNNQITENERLNIIRYDGLLQGAGVGVLDVNNDGLMDVYYAGNMVPDQLYLNKGNLQFENITSQAGITGENSWSTGISIVDINGDGYDDIYVCKFLYDEAGTRDNLLFINQQDNTFKESSKDYGLADPGYGIMATFLDYDRDGDLDMYVANQPPNNLEMKAKLEGKRTAVFTDRLYRNDGGRFTNVTGAAGITNFSYSLSAISFDYNDDGWPDIYVASDYEEPDFLYKNNGDGTFTDVIHDAMNHISNFSMGSDIADINRDGHVDLFVVDMVAEDNYRQKTNMSGMNPEKFWGLANAGYHYQYMYNAMQLNNGNETFSEMAHMGGISSTDWSWTPLFVDFDLDGYDDLFVTNGIIKEVRNKDYTNWRKEYVKKKHQKGERLTNDELLELSEKTPSVKVLDNLFRNTGNLQFEHVEKEWGIHEPSWSQGAAYADFDNDGDLDIVINNMNSVTTLYENKSTERSGNNYINITLKGKDKNLKGIGSKIVVASDSGTKTCIMTPYKGYMSTSEAVCNFGLGMDRKIQSIKVTWPNGVTKKYDGARINSTIALDQSEGEVVQPKATERENNFARLSQEIRHEEDNYDDYATEVLLPHKMSTLGPFVAKADVDGDGNEDFFIGGSAGHCGRLARYDQETQKFQLTENPWCADRDSEDGGAEFVDLDGDGDQDLIVSSGGNQFKEGSPLYRSRAYLNDGQGNFSKKQDWPGENISSSVIIPLDFDQDGDEDIFIGGRQIPGKYGRPASSQLIENKGNGKFVNVSAEYPVFSELGMVTDGIWYQEKGMNSPQLILVGDWMPITTLTYASEDGWAESDLGKKLDKTNGWWNTISAINLDDDSTKELLVGNAGLNIKYKASEETPFKAFIDDFDQNGTNDVYLGQVFNDGNYDPVRVRQCSSEQMPFIKKEFKNYDVFASTTFENILGERIDSTSILNHVYTFETGYLDMDSAGYFVFNPLPMEAQMAPTFAFVELDVDRDGQEEIVGAGNYYNREVETTRSDAGYGFVLQSFDNKLKTEPLHSYGIDASGDVRFVEKLKMRDTNPIVIVGVNNSDIRIYSMN